MNNKRQGQVYCSRDLLYKKSSDSKFDYALYSVNDADAWRFSASVTNGDLDDQEKYAAVQPTATKQDALAAISAEIEQVAKLQPMIKAGIQPVLDALVNAGILRS